MIMFSGHFFLILLFLPLILGDKGERERHDPPEEDLQPTASPVTLSPSSVYSILLGKTGIIKLNVTYGITSSRTLLVTSLEPTIVSLPGNVTFPLHKESAMHCDNEYVIDDVTNCTWTFDVSVHGEFLGTTKLSFGVIEAISIVTQFDSFDSAYPVYLNNDAHKKNIGSIENIGTYDIKVIRRPGLAYKVYMILSYILLIAINLGLGAEVDLEVLKYVVKKPVAPAIGFFCQFVTLPVISFGLSRVESLPPEISLGLLAYSCAPIGFGLSRVGSLPPEISFGLLAYSCAPGGGMSNVWAKVLGGDVTLSLFMTSVSNLAALGMMPFWMWLFGRFVIDPSLVVIPYLDIVKVLLSLVGTCLIGFLLGWWKRPIGQVLVKIASGLSPFFALFHLIYIPFVNWYIFEAIARYPLVNMPAVLLPVLGFLAGYAIAVITGQNHKDSLTIAIETSIQNVGIPLIMLMYVFPQPYGDLGIVLPIWSAYVTAVPLYIAYIILKLVLCVKKRREKSQRVPLDDLEVVDGVDV